MKVKTLLNKLRLNEYQTIRVLDYKSEYFIESTSKKGKVYITHLNNVVLVGE